ncbi:MAG: type II toxin-antitoxin system RelE/ParE family toxin [Nitrospira sp.]|nr:type II toxin-antitoxin system RelE/ParE family toxin [Nitrospira sp.]
MIRTFADRHTAELYEVGKAKRFPTEIWRVSLRKLQYLDSASRADDLKVPLSNRLHKLKEDREGQYSISVNMKWRICFRFIDGDAYDVELTDYH